MRRGLWVALALATAACSGKGGSGTEGNSVRAGALPLVVPGDAPSPAPTPLPSPASTTVEEGDPARAATSEMVSGDAEGGESTQPSFDCGGRISAVESMICDDPHLAKMDALLARTYESVRADADADGRAELLTGQREFLLERNQCADVECIEDAYAKRLSELND